MIISRTFGTHDGTFHADEVTACALLLFFDLIDLEKIYRTRDPNQLATCDFVCDVGGVYDPEKRRFDHHQVDYSGELSSAGMILKYLKEIGKLDARGYRLFNESLILGVDAHDNGRDPQIVGLCTYSHIIANFVPISADDAKSQDLAFFKALDFAKGHLERMWARDQYIQSCREQVQAVMQKGGRCLIFDKRIPWQEPFFELGGASHPAEFVVMPSREHWMLRGIPPNTENKMGVRHPLPQEWAGLLEEELRRISGIEGAIFCHKGRFVSVWKTKEDALRAYQYVIGEENG